MNILLISHDFTVTGAPNSLLRQAKYFRDAGHNVDVWGLGDGPLKERYIESGFNPSVIKNDSKDIKNAWRKRKHNYDFILCNTTVTYKAVDFLQRKKIPLVWFIRETKLVDDGMRDNPDFAKVFSNFYNLYTVSEYAANVSKKYNQNVRFLNNAIEDKFKKFKKTGKKIVFGYIGSIIPVKGVDLLVDAFNKLAEKNKNIELYIAGSCYDEYGKNLQGTSCSAVKWLGEIQGKDKEKFFDNIDILVVPSLDEPSGLTVLEGAMYGKPVITTDKTGAKYIVSKGKSGFIVKTGDVDDLYKHMQKIIKMNIDDLKKASRKMYLKYGTTDREQKQVLSMLEANKDNLPVIKHHPINKKRLINIETTTSGRKHIYFYGIKIASYKSYHNRVLKKFRKTHKINFDDKNIVSLGWNCLPRAILTLWGLKRTKEMGELSYPFDLAIHPTEALTKLLKNNFNGFLDNFIFHPSDESWLQHGAKGFWVNQKYDFQYIHDEDCGENELEKLVTRLANRVKNWNKMMKDKKSAVFVLNLDTDNMNLNKNTAESVANNLIDEIFELRKGLKTKIIVICQLDIQLHKDNTFVCYAPLPWKGYTWHLKDRFSKKGIEYEHRISQFCYNILSQKD